LRRNISIKVEKDVLDLHYFFKNLFPFSQFKFNQTHSKTLVARERRNKTKIDSEKKRRRKMGEK